MLSENVLFQVCSYLTLPDLLQMKRVNRKYRKVASNPSFFKQEFLRIYFPTCDRQLRISANWPRLCYSMLIHEKTFKSLSTSPALKPYIGELFSILTSILINPDIPIPKLRKEQFVFPTAIQDMLANIEDQETDSVFSHLQNFKFFETALSNPVSFKNQLVLPALQVYFQLAETYCEAICLAIEDSEDPLLAYVDFWEHFSFSVVNLMTFTQQVGASQAFCDFRNGFSLGANVHGIMIGLWKAKVWKNVQKLINSLFMDSFVKLLHKDDAENELILCIRLVEAIFDISLNEFSVYFKAHSKSEFEEPFKVMENHILEVFRGLRITEPNDLERLNFLTRILPSSLLLKIVAELKMIEDCKDGFEDFKLHIERQDFMIEYWAKKIGISQSEIGRYSCCRNSDIFDLLTHLKNFKQDVCN